MQRLIITLAIITLAQHAVTAETYTWISTVNGTWNTPANWASASGSYPQQPGDVVVFSNIGLNNVTIDITIPAGAVTCGVMQCSHVTNLYRIGGAAWNTSFLVLTNVNDTARIAVTEPRTTAFLYSLQFRNCSLVMTHPTEIRATFGASGIYFENTTHWQGNTIVTTRSSSTVQYLRIDPPSPQFYGTVVVAERDIFVRASTALTNAQLVKTVRNTTAFIENREATTLFPLKLENGTQYHLTSNGAGGAHQGALVIEGAVIIDADNLLTLSGTISGTGTVAMTGSTAGTGIARFTGAIAPGASAGILTFNENAGVLQLGTGADSLDLDITVAGAGGVAGTDHDQIIVQNLDVALNLANINVAFSGVASGFVTNWFLIGNNIDLVYCLINKCTKLLRYDRMGHGAANRARGHG